MNILNQLKTPAMLVAMVIFGVLTLVSNHFLNGKALFSLSSILGAIVGAVVFGVGFVLITNYLQRKRQAS